MNDKTKQALEFALEALERLWSDGFEGYPAASHESAIVAIREALAEHPAQQEQKPWVGLTDEEVKHQWEVWRANAPRYMGFATGIEAKLKEKNT